MALQTELDKYTRNFVLKSLQVIVQSRMGEKCRYTAKDNSSLEWNERKADHQGEIEVKESDTDVFTIPIPDIPELSAVARKTLGTGPVLAQPVCVEISLKMKENNAYIFLELWSLTLDVENCEPDVKVSISTLYGRMTSALKSILSISRVAPAYRLAQRQKKDDFQIHYQYSLGPPNVSLLCENVQNRRIGQVVTPAGAILVNLAYTTKPQMPQQTKPGVPLHPKIDHFSEPRTHQASEPKPCNRKFRNPTSVEDLQNLNYQQDTFNSTFSTSPPDGYVCSVSPPPLPQIDEASVTLSDSVDGGHKKQEKSTVLQPVKMEQEKENQLVKMEKEKENQPIKLEQEDNQPIEMEQEDNQPIKMEQKSQPIKTEQEKENQPIKIEQEKENQTVKRDQEKENQPIKMEQEKKNQPIKIEQEENQPNEMEQEKKIQPIKMEQEEKNEPIKMEQEKENQPDEMEQEKKNQPIEMEQEKKNEPIKMEQEKKNEPIKIEQEKNQPIKIEQKKNEPVKMEQEENQPDEMEQEKKNQPIKMKQEEKNEPIKIRQEKENQPIKIEQEKKNEPVKMEQEKKKKEAPSAESPDVDPLDAYLRNPFFHDDGNPPVQIEKPEDCPFASLMAGLSVPDADASLDETISDTSSNEEKEGEGKGKEKKEESEDSEEEEEEEEKRNDSPGSSSYVMVPPMESPFQDTDNPTTLGEFYREMQKASLAQLSMCEQHTVSTDDFLADIKSQIDEFAAKQPEIDKFLKSLPKDKEEFSD